MKYIRFRGTGAKEIIFGRQVKNVMWGDWPFIDFYGMRFEMEDWLIGLIPMSEIEYINT